jgi:hypothetical protein
MEFCDICSPVKLCRGTRCRFFFVVGQTLGCTGFVDRKEVRIVPIPSAFFAVCPGLSEYRPEYEKQHEVLDVRHLVELRSDFQPLEWVYLSVN